MIRVRVDTGATEWEGDLVPGVPRMVQQVPPLTVEVTRVTGLVEAETHAAAVKRAESAEALAKMASRSYGKGTLVSVDPALVERVREADAGAVLSAAFDACEQCGMRRDWTGLTGCPSCATRRAIADAVLAQLGGDR